MALRNAVNRKERKSVSLVGILILIAALYGAYTFYQKKVAA